MKKLYALLMAVLMAGCPSRPVKPYGEALRETCNSGGVVKFAVLLVEQNEMAEAYERMVGKKIPDGLELRGYSGTTEGDIWVMVVSPLRGQLDHERLAERGHEIAHIVCGSWHNDPVAE